ncbi:Eco57I restriction-modification methylase domain-containing protein [Desulfatirhabdium butyrativorans]|uniref:Eco57I restriction-modification methylase domain-containing protein n=1 Tax=Desulfatirhabdium butyrativorans TaxID=340467 RepID=UPI00040E6AB8|nr:N-6 DNA methylase [Desulfatirhabdium butyrativorans]
MSVPSKIRQLVEKFDAGFNEFKLATYGETQVRVAFINPFFEALGWDMTNRNNREVTHEYALLDDRLSKIHPDYCFNGGGPDKMFFVEAKKPSVNLEAGFNPALQIRRYAWTANHPIGVLTDFEEFSAYYGRGIEPKTGDGPDVARFFYCNFRDYLKRWDEIYAIFSREAVLSGSLERNAYVMKSRRGSQEVDDVFLNDIEAWRSLLASHIASYNPNLTQRELNASVQQTIDRIIFLRICEDREIEPYGTLEKLLSSTSIYQKLVRLFRDADAKYNSGLFHFQDDPKRGELADTIALNLTIHDEPLRQIIQRLYFPHGPYAFSVMPADILGHVYERFLGKIIQVQADRSVVVEEKPEVRKAGGVYYTPTYIVDYIVRNTVGKLLDGKRPDEVSGIRVLDPACGSGSFLIRAYQYLLDWHLEWYLNHDPKKHARGKAPKLYRDSNDHWHLTIAERKRILLNNIYGVDIDAQAVEVSKLSLLLKVLEGEDSQSMNRQLALFRERALPDLGNNIKCGNSLIGRDFYAGQQMSLFGMDEKLRINAFDWETEFADAMKAGGFDAVIGNPPYVRQETLGAAFKGYAKANFSTFTSSADLYVYFIEKAHKLLKIGGLFGFICSNKFMRANYGGSIRAFLTQNTTLYKLVDFGELPVFQSAATFPLVILTINQKPEKQQFIYASIKKLDFPSLDDEVANIGQFFDDTALNGDNWTLAATDEISLMEKMRRIGTPLGKYIDGKIYYGIKTGLNEAFIIDRENRDRLIAEDEKSGELIKPFAIGDYIRKYRIEGKERYVILIPRGWTNQQSGGLGNDSWDWFRQNYPAIACHLEPFAEKAKKRCDKGDYWWELRACDYYDAFAKPKIVYPDISKESRITFDKKGTVVGNTAYFIPSNDLYLLGLLNSRLIFLYFKRNASVLGDADKGGRLRWFTQDVVKIPIRCTDSQNKEDAARHARMVELVQKMLDLHKQLSVTRLKQEIEELKRDIAYHDKEIDRLVYELYGLTDKEIAIVEGG